ncbi:MAG: hypothetical protein ACFE0K_06990 [Alcanivorax sp.]|uniref:hypothetical protein n=1 Tax=Alcanivorax sp. TaxID=1872427 RepID=UPI003DA78CEF
MEKRLTVLLAALMAGGVSGCVVVPTPDRSYASPCQTMSTRMTLMPINVASSTGSYDSSTGMGSLLLFPATALVSGALVGANNLYNMGEERISCKA